MSDLHDYYTAEYIREATDDERAASRDAAAHDGGAGVILLDESGQIVAADDRDADAARRVYVID